MADHYFAGSRALLNSIILSLSSIVMAVVAVPNTAQQGLKAISVDVHQVLVVAGFEIDIGKTG